MLLPTIDLLVSGGLNTTVERELGPVADIIADYNTRLAEEGWIVVIVPVPVKLAIYRERCEWPARDLHLLRRNMISADHSDEVYVCLQRELDKRGVINLSL